MRFAISWYINVGLRSVGKPRSPDASLAVVSPLPLQYRHFMKRPVANRSCAASEKGDLIGIGFSKKLRRVSRKQCPYLYLIFILRRALIIATSAALGAIVVLCALVVALHPRSTDAGRELLTVSQPAAAEDIMMVLFEPHRFHLRHDGQAEHIKSS